MNSRIKDKIRKAPKSPGIYFWLNKAGEILYIGRATSLRNRLSQYLQTGIEPRIQEMVKQAVNIKYQVTASLLEAIILEAKNIKNHWPKYNVKDRDDRSFIYIFIPKGAFPRPLIIRGRELDKLALSRGKVFGPYQSFQLINGALRLIRRIFPYSTCQAHSGHACFDYQIGLCPGTCLGKISASEYQKNINNICLLLNGDKKRLLTKLMRENPDKIKSLEHLQDVSLLSREENLQEIKISRLEGYDISHHAGRESYGAMVVSENGEASPAEYRLFKIKTAPAGDDERALLEVLIRRFKHQEWPLPELIMIDGGSPQISFLTKELAKNNINIPLIGLSKFGNDKLVFSTSARKGLKILAENIKPTLLKLREEAHRFANRGRKMGSKIKLKNRP